MSADAARKSACATRPVRESLVRRGGRPGVYGALGTRGVWWLDGSDRLWANCAVFLAAGVGAGRERLHFEVFVAGNWRVGGGVDEFFHLAAPEAP
jgi:hypothetical protein